ncbi:MAG: glycosyltransferase [Bacteroidales bacterium]|nr:glycosyltransferase [Bacteroidales bacterium]
MTSFYPEIRIIFIDDGSKDETPVVIQTLVKSVVDINILYLRFTRNFGKELAVKCGIDHSTADYCAIMDGDLQHPSEKLIEAYEKIAEDNSSLVYISPLKRQKHFHQKLGTYGYKKMINSFSKDKVFLTDFSLMDKKAVDLIKLYKESDFYTRGILSVIGLKSSEIYYIPKERLHGKTNFSFKKSINLAIDGIISVSTKPLRIAIYVGIFTSIMSILFGTYLIVEKIIMGQPIPGFATLGFGLFFFGGIQLLFLGLIGEYVGKIYLQVKNRPVYVVDKQLTNGELVSKKENSIPEEIIHFQVKNQNNQ